jgi:cyclopropane fatty-acyl-phospholipid synthase-like methyltransferase
MNSFENIKKQYKAEFDKHGDSPKSILTPKGRNANRYSVITDYVDFQTELDILDYGCGLGYLYEYLKPRYSNLNYHGYDLMPDFISHCKDKFTDNNSHFSLVQPEKKIKKKFDVVFASGVFNLKSSEFEAESMEYAFSKIKELYDCYKQLFIVDFPSQYVDFIYPGAQHFNINEITDFCINNLSRKFIIRHDKLPYEFTLVAWRNDTILRPLNIFENET